MCIEIRLFEMDNMIYQIDTTFNFFKLPFFETNETEYVLFLKDEISSFDGKYVNEYNSLYLILEND